MKKLLIILTIVLSLHVAKGQTNISGGIYSNTIWTKINSPYIVTGNIVLFPGKTLTVEPGVTVKFNTDYNIEIRGALIAKGTITDSIYFISNTSSTQGSWGGIKILNSSQNAVGSFEYCVVKHSTFGVGVECCWGNSSTYIKRSWFDNNNVASSSYAGWALPIDSCLFTNNIIAVDQGDKKVTNSTFINNNIGIHCSRYEVRKSVFQNNNGAINWELANTTYATIDSCIIINNNLGVRITGGTITNSNISNNVIGIITQHSSYVYDSIEYYIPIRKNKICNNITYNIKNDNNFNKDITQNCFCTSDSTIIEDKLYDGYDDINLGLFNYDIYDTACQIIIQSIYKVGTNPTSISNLAGEYKVSIFPNPFSTETILKADDFFTNGTLTAYSVGGQKVKEIKNISGQKYIFNRENLSSGIYFLHITQSDKVFPVFKLIVTDN